MCDPDGARHRKILYTLSINLQVEHILSERKLLLELHHPFIVNLEATFQGASCEASHFLLRFSAPSKKYTACLNDASNLLCTDETCLFLVLEYVCGGEFFTHLREREVLETNVAQFYAAQVASIFKYLHGRSVIYRDLKPENMLLDHGGYLKLADFGFAKHCEYKTYTLCGTPEYMAPEVLLGKGHGKGVDWWTLGVLLFEMLAGEPPFVDDDPMKIYQLIMRGDIVFPASMDRPARSLIKKLLTADLTRRYGCLAGGANDVLQHRFFKYMDWEALSRREMHIVDPACRIKPNVKGADDTSMFDEYPDDNEGVQLPVYDGPDPFVGF